MNRTLFVWIGLLLFACGEPASTSGSFVLPDRVDFNFHIKPILSDRCFTCHGPDDKAREAGLRLDTPEGAFALLEDSSHYALVPGDPDRSQLYHRIRSTDPETVMPPPESNLALSEYEIALLSRWIEQGAEWKAHWSFLPVSRPEIPEIPEGSSLTNPIDRFVAARLQERGLRLSPEADKELLLRRVSLDLTGLPPGLSEMESFLKDSSPDAYEKVVDRLLASPHYGERMATEWLDLARYADSHGYQDDGMRTVWPWRDWVIQSYNDNLPYDQFVTWQLAGDLLPHPTDEQLLATTFNRNHLQTQEGGVVPEEYRTEYVADRTQTFSKAFLGLTMECARCHDHKYDPLSQKEYYQLFAFFNNVNEYGQIPYSGESCPTVILTDQDVKEKLSFLQAQMDETEQKMAHLSYEGAFQSWRSQIATKGLLIKETGLLAHYPLDRVVEDKSPNLVQTEPAVFRRYAEHAQPQTIAGKVGQAQLLESGNYFALGDKVAPFERHEPFSVSLWLKIMADSTHGPIFSRSGGLFNGNRGFDCMLRKDGTLTASLNHVWPHNAIEIETTERLPVGEWVHLTMTYDGSSQAQGLQVYLNGKALPQRVLNDHLNQSIIYAQQQHTWGATLNMAIGLRFEETIEGAAVDDCKIFDHCLHPWEVDRLAKGTATLLVSTPDEAQLRAYFLRTQHPAYQALAEELIRLRGEENALLTEQTEVMIMRDRPFEEPRATYVLNRGQYDQPTPQRVFPGTPASVFAFSESLSADRLGLAKWLFDARNPLTARVVVNRYWQMLFGRGLVKSSDDFGSQGELPSHPALLDWLAREYRSNGWDTKAFLKMVVLSATYRQSSLTSPDLLEHDPENIWLARGPGMRLSAEMVRDQALAASGLLVREIGGPSVKPYQPPGLWEQLATRNATRYVQQHGDSLYRRSMYTIWKRTTPPPSMINFDTPERNACTVLRQRTSTPLQALVLLNDPQYVEAARILGEQMLTVSAEPEEQVDLGFRLLTGRRPRLSEGPILLELMAKQQNLYKGNPLLADSLLSTGEHPRNLSLEPAQLAAATVVASMIMNSDAAIMKR